MEEKINQSQVNVIFIRPVCFYFVKYDIYIITGYEVNTHAYRDLPEYSHDWPLSARKSPRVLSSSANKRRHFTTIILWIRAEWVKDSHRNLIL